MKKIIAAAAFLFSIGMVQAQTDTASPKNVPDIQKQKGSKGTRYDYYPSANVYFNTRTQQYSYLDSTSHQWQSNAQLPSSYLIDSKSRKNSFYYNGDDVWRQNADHIKTYGSKDKNNMNPNKPNMQY